MRGQVVDAVRLGLGLLLAAAALAGCTGTVESSNPPGSSAESGSGPGGPSVAEIAACRGKVKPEAGTTLLRRLSRRDYSNSVRQLLQVDTGGLIDLPADERLGLFFANTSAPADEGTVQRYVDGAERIAAKAVASLPKLLPCDPTKVGDDACADQFIATFVRRAYRRPITTEEIDAFKLVYQQGKQRDGSLRSGIELVIRAALSSVSFLYLLEDGTATKTPGVEALTGYALASRLSYFLWGSVPDEPLLAAAARGALDTPPGLRAEAVRLLNDERARDAIAEFHRRWLDIGELGSKEKDPALYPIFASLRDPMMRETEQFADYVVRRGDGKLETLLTAPYSFVGKELANVYRVAIPAGQNPNEPVALDPKQRAGVLTQPSILAAHSYPNQTSPIHRGLFVLKLACTMIPPPPPNVQNMVPKPGGAKTTRERFAQHRADPGCATCHNLLDPVGFGFEHYDTIGVYRDYESGKPVDATGQLTGTDVDGPFDGAIELGGRLAGSNQLRACVAQHWFRYALARADQDRDACAAATLFETFKASGWNIRELMVAIATSDAFRFRAAETGP